MDAIAKDYIGDGLYVEYLPDRSIRIWTERETGVHEVFLEPMVFEALENFNKRMKMIFPISEEGSRDAI